LPAIREYSLGPVSYTLLDAEVAPGTTEQDALKIQIRMTNNDRRDASLLDKSFHLLLDGVAVAPDNNLNELVPAQSVRDGDVLFTIPHGFSDARLKISYLDEGTEVALILQ